MSINQLLGYRDIQLSYLEAKHSTHWQAKRNKRAVLHIFRQEKKSPPGLTFVLSVKVSCASLFWTVPYKSITEPAPRTACSKVHAYM